MKVAPFDTVAHTRKGEGEMGKGKKPSPRVRRAAETNEAVERIIACTQRAAADLAPIPQAAENVRRLRRGMGTTWPYPLVEAYGAEKVLSLDDYVLRNAVVDLWRLEGRIAYDLHPEMAAKLHRADLKGKVPGDLFSRLPHRSPLVPLPRPWPFQSGRKGLIRGFFLTGVVGKGGDAGLCITTDPRSDGLGVMPWIEWEGAGPDDYEKVVTPLFVLPSTRDAFTVADIVDHTNDWHGTETDGNERKIVKQILPGAISVLMYLCCDNRDMPEHGDRGPGASKRGRAAPPRDPFYVRVGWHIGPKLHAARLLAQGGGQLRDGVSVPSGVEYGPQHRVGHFKWVHHGPARSQQSFKWIDPYWTKLDLLEEMRAEGREPSTGIIPVDAQRRDPAGHRDVKLSNLGRAKEREIREREAQRSREDDWDW
jgi:hypothetical protein